MERITDRQKDQINKIIKNPAHWKTETASRPTCKEKKINEQGSRLLTERTNNRQDWHKRFSRYAKPLLLERERLVVLMLWENRLRYTLQTTYSWHLHHKRAHSITWHYWRDRNWPITTDLRSLSLIANSITAKLTNQITRTALMILYKRQLLTRLL